MQITTNFEIEYTRIDRILARSQVPHARSVLLPMLFLSRFVFVCMASRSFAISFCVLINIIHVHIHTMAHNDDDNNNK